MAYELSPNAALLKVVVRGPVPVREALVAGPQQAARMKRKIAVLFNSLNGLLCQTV